MIVMQPKKQLMISTAKDFRQLMRHEAGRFNVETSQANMKAPFERRKFISSLIAGRMAKEMEAAGRTLEEHPEFKAQLSRRVAKVNAIGRALLKATNASDKEKALFRLIGLGSRQAVPFIERALNDRNADVRLTAVYGLLTLKAVESMPLIEKIRDKDSDETIRDAAVYALKRLAGLRENK
ncbi:HEAT repeat domain-containing protein [archaeon]|nr:HEAT repeat domain-containing protein [archaeon]